MLHALARNLVHCVFSTKGRAQLMKQSELLWSRLALIARSIEIPLITAGGTRDHVHMLLALPTTMTLEKAVQDLKAHTSRWMKEDVRGFTWQEGYGAFSVSESQRQIVTDYIAAQEAHHRKWTFEQEFLALVCKAGIEYDPQFLFG
jgi:REP element-mobilizing transposase RayT